MDAAPRFHFPPEVLSSLCRPYAHASDTMLALHEMTRARPAHPGECVKCFFRLKGMKPRETSGALQHFHRWLESNVEIKVQVDEREQGTMPLFLDGSSLEEFCTQTMQRAREDRADTATKVFLELCFREEAA